jgi:hypothetical protein
MQADRPESGMGAKNSAKSSSFAERPNASSHGLLLSPLGTGTWTGAGKPLSKDLGDLGDRLGFGGCHYLNFQDA